MGIYILIITATVLGLFMLIFFLLMTRCFKKAPKGTAMIREGSGGTVVSFGKMWVFPVIHKMEIMDITIKALEIDLKEKNGIFCKDNIRVDIKIIFYVMPNHTEDDIITVARTLGTQRASDMDTLHQLFTAKFSEALKTVLKRFDFIDIYHKNYDELKAYLLETIGRDLNGYHLDDCVIVSIEPTAKVYLDPNNILDAAGIKKFEELKNQQKA